MKKKYRPEIDYTGWTKEQHIAHLKTDATYQKKFELNDPHTIEGFIESYAVVKTALYEKKEEYTQLYERFHTQFLNKADSYIDRILQKKLFNLQCQWRANLIDLPLVLITRDFHYWAENIRICPFIPPITEKEIDLCIRFLKEEIDWDDNDYAKMSWQHFNGFRDGLLNQQPLTDEERIAYGMGEDCKEDEYPYLYAFFDTHQNTNDWLSVYDLRGNIEHEYSLKRDDILEERYEKEIKEEEEKEKKEEAAMTDEMKKEKARAYFAEIDNEKWIKLVQQFEDRQTKELFKLLEFAHRNDKQSEYFECPTIYSTQNDPIVYFDFLRELGENIPIVAKPNDSWRVALERTVRKYQQNKIADMLPYAYETYLLEFDQLDNIPQLIADRVARFSFDTSTESYKNMLKHRDEFLEGREALTGRRDFDYL